MDTVQIGDKYLLTVREASLYFNIGEKTLRKMLSTDTDGCYSLKNGNRTMIKRKAFEHMIQNMSSIC